MRPYLETLFRSKLLVLVPSLLLPALVFAGLRAMPPSYEVGATLWVDAATDEAPNYSGTAPSASAIEARAFQERLRTEAFRERVVRDSGLEEQVETYAWPQPQAPGSLLAGFVLTRPLGKALGAVAATTPEEAWERATDAVLKQLSVTDLGHNLLTVSYKGPDRETGLKLVAAAIEANNAEKAVAAQRKAEGTSNVQSPVVAALVAEMRAAHDAYAEYASALSLSPTAAEQRKLEDLQKTYFDASNRLQQLKIAQAQATLETLAEWTNKASSLTVIDAPGGSLSPTMGLKLQLALTVIGGVLGVALGATLVVLRTWLDGTVRGAASVETRLNLPVLAVVPAIERRQERGASW
jgi:uncharacterized protein involved in exopolysaccharide biosynthesis